MTPKKNQTVLRYVLDLMDGNKPFTLQMHPEATIVAVQPHRNGVEMYAVSPIEAKAGEGLAPATFIVVETGTHVIDAATYAGSAMLPGMKPMHVFRLA